MHKMRARHGINIKTNNSSKNPLLKLTGYPLAQLNRTLDIL